MVSQIHSLPLKTRTKLSLKSLKSTTTAEEVFFDELRMALWLRLSLLLLFLVVVVSSLPTSLLKRRSRDNELFDGSDQLTDDEGTQSRGRHFGKKSGSKKNESAINEKRSQRRRRKHNDNVK
ncbi:unnamed protein product [Heterobilharzia americana]|nr:unnamed protein product [Heterobilharzia americana]